MKIILLYDVLSIVLEVTKLLCEPSHKKKQQFGFPTRADTKRPVH